MNTYQKTTKKTSGDVRKHACVVISLFVSIFGVSLHGFLFDKNRKDQTWQEIEHSLALVIFVTISRVLICFGLPFALLNFAGIVCFSSTKNPVCCRNSPFLAPYICFRVVTKGLFPDLVRKNVDKNINVCLGAGVVNFIFEVVTDKAVHLKAIPYTRELVVPNQYQTRHKSKFKARALHFCNEADVNLLNPDDWIVHLDEETLLTEECVYGILNFVSSGEADFGQGVITYASEAVVNWVTTLIDSVRVGIDYGYLKFTLSVLRRPVLNWKGSFVVARAAAEHDVSFDHGLEGSIAEDCYFGVLASMKGYKFGFVEGEMLEQSTFTFTDFIKQRKRWNQGMYLVCRSKALPFRHKLGVLCIVTSALSMPLCTFGCVLTLCLGIPMSPFTGLLLDFIQGMFIFLFVFGTHKSLARRGCEEKIKYALMSLSVCVIPVGILLENIASVWASLSLNDIHFHVVRKDNRQRPLDKIV